MDVTPTRMRARDPPAAFGALTVAVGWRRNSIHLDCTFCGGAVASGMSRPTGRSVAQDARTMPKPDPAEQSRSRRERILDAAFHAFATRGYRDTAVDDIAGAAETSKGGIYFHFPTKEAIFRE